MSGSRGYICLFAFFLHVDESSSFDALQTLADLSLMMPAAENEDGKCTKFCFSRSLHESWLMAIWDMLGVDSISLSPFHILS